VIIRRSLEQIDYKIIRVALQSPYKDINMIAVYRHPLSPRVCRVGGKDRGASRGGYNN